MINVPEGFDARTNFINSALFSWDPAKTSNKLQFLD